MAEIDIIRKKYKSAKDKLQKVLEMAPEQLEATRMILRVHAIEDEWGDILRITSPYIERDIQLEWLLMFHLSALGYLRKDDEIKELFMKYPQLTMLDKSDALNA